MGFKVDNSTARPASRWGQGIAIVYGVFVVFMLSAVFFSRFHQVDLISRDYYDREMSYQSQINRIVLRDSLGAHVRMEYIPNDKQVRLAFPQQFAAESVRGTIQLFRPADAGLDRTIPVAPDKSGVQLLDLSKTAKGNWKLLISWSADTLDFYEEQSIYVE